MPKIGMKEIRQNQVIEATKRSIVKKGLSNLSIKDIAEEAGISTGVIYHYFKNKDDVLLKVLKESFRLSHERVMQTVEPLNDPKEKLFKHIENINAVPNDNSEFYIVLLNYLGEAVHHQEIRSIVNKFLRNLRDYSADYLSELHDDRCEPIPLIIYAMGLGLGIMWTLDNRAYPIEQMGGVFKDVIARYLR